MYIDTYEYTHKEVAYGYAYMYIHYGLQPVVHPCFGVSYMKRIKIRRPCWH